MTINTQKLKEVHALVMQPIVAAVAAGAGVVLAHGFTFFVSTAVWHGALFGLLQSAVAYQLSQRLPGRNVFANYIISHLIIGIALYGLSLLAFKVGLITSVVTLPCGVTLITLTAIMGLAATLCGNSLADRFQWKTS